MSTPTRTSTTPTRMRRMTVVLTCAVTLGAGLTACGGESSADSGTCPGGKIRFGVEPYEDPAKLIPIYEQLGKALEADLDCPVEVVVADTYVAEILAMKNEQLEIGQFGPLGYVFAEEQADARPIVSFADEDGEVSSYTAGVWVAKDADIANVAELADRTLALSEPGSTSGDALPRKALVEEGIEKDVSIDYAGGHTEALLALTNGKVDAAEINSQTLGSAVEEGIFDPGDYRQVWESDPIANDPITVAPHTSRAFQAAVEEALLNLKREHVAPIGEYLDFTPSKDKSPMVKVDKATYQPMVELADSLNLTQDDL